MLMCKIILIKYVIEFILIIMKKIREEQIHRILVIRDRF